MAVSGHNMKIHAINPHFGSAPSSCALEKPTRFEWSLFEGDVRVYCENGHESLLPNHLDPTKKNFLWLCESPMVDYHLFGNLRGRLWNDKDLANSFDAIFTCEDEVLNRFPNSYFAPTGSNYPWTAKEHWGIHQKNKLISALSSSKVFTPGHRERIRKIKLFNDAFYQQHDQPIDCFGGVNNSPKIGQGDFVNSWPGKERALKGYAFSIVIENVEIDKYYTEKITDCFAMGTIPIYSGTRRICEDFNCDGILWYDDVFNNQIPITMDVYMSKLDAIKDNYERVQQLKISDDYLFDTMEKFL